jgi:type I restriction enzyme S subunit
MSPAWLDGSLEDLCEIEYGTRIVKSQTEGSTFPVLGGGGETFRADEFNRQDRMVISRFAMSKRCVRFVHGKFFLNDSGLTVATRDPSILLQEFVDAQLLARGGEIYRLGQGMAQINLDVKRFKLMKISYPDSLDEQRRIAAILDKAHEVLSKRKAALETLETLSQAIFIEMFGDPATNPMGWPLIEIGELTSSGTESLNPIHASQELFELYSIPAFDAGGPIETIGSDIGSTKQLLQSGDVLLSKIVPHIRRAWVVGKKIGLRKVGSSEWIVFRGSECHPEFIRQLITSDSFHNLFMRTVSGVGGSLLRARPSLVAKILVPLPPFKLQQEFGDSITSVSRQSLILQNQRKDLTQLFDSLQKKAFRGAL